MQSERAKREKREYSAARHWAMRQLARENPERYEALVERRLGRPLDKAARTLTYRQKTGERRDGESYK